MQSAFMKSEGTTSSSIMPGHESVEKRLGLGDHLDSAAAAQNHCAEYSCSDVS